MFLKELTISNNSEIIRKIPFHKGLNLIVDETKTTDRRESGNNVGKTTVLRLIDFCLGSDGKNIYIDPEYKGQSNTNTNIEYFLKQNNIIISLVLKEDLDNLSSKEITVRRNFLSKKNKILEINGEKKTLTEYPKELKKLIFQSQKEKPKFRQIVAKNVRDEKNRLINTLKVLNPFTTVEEYESLFLFWFGIEPESNAEKQNLLRQQTIDKKILKRLEQETSLHQIEQSLIIVNRLIKNLTDKKDNFDINENYEKDLKTLNNIKSAINEKSLSISNLEMRLALITESKIELENEISNVDVDKIKSLYNEAKVLIPSLQKTYKETLDFHNSMIKHRLEYITKETPQLTSELITTQRALTNLLTDEKTLTHKLVKSGAIDELQKVILELNQSFENKGKLEEKKNLFTSLHKKILERDIELQRIDKGISSKEVLMNERITDFNKWFSSISSELYGEPFVLSLDKREKGYGLKISSLIGNPGTGMKKGQIAAFDLSYIQFADAQGIRCLHFVLQDQIENVHENQINSLLTKIVTEINCQYIVPVLSDKLPSDLDILQYQAVSLSQSDKLFKLS